MIALFGLLAIIIISLIAVRIGSIAFELTGLSTEASCFQAQSAFSGVGFTTSESEAIVNHPVRRRIVRILMLFGNAGFTSSIATFILTFIGQSGKSIAIRAMALMAGLLIIVLISRSKFVYQVMKKIITKALEKYTSLNIYDYQEILGIGKGYTISRILVKHNSWMVGKRLKDLKLHLEGLLILSIHKIVEGSDEFIEIPTANTVIQEGDIFMCYGRGDAAKKLAQRRKGIEGDKDHMQEIKKEQIIEETREELK